MNTPYVKKYDAETGEVLNPIIHSYQSRRLIRTDIADKGKVSVEKPTIIAYPNRWQRRNAHKRDKHGMVRQMVPYYVDGEGFKYPFTITGSHVPLTLKFKAIYHKKPYLA